MAKSFVSYRRIDSTSDTRRIVASLVRRFGESAVISDVFGINGGQSFRKVIANRLKPTKVFLAVVGSHWIDAVGGQGLRRLDDPADYFRFEIEAVLSCPGCINDQQITNKKALPDSIAELVDRHAIEVRPPPISWTTWRASVN